MKEREQNEQIVAHSFPRWRHRKFIPSHNSEHKTKIENLLSWNRKYTTNSNGRDSGGVRFFSQPILNQHRFRFFLRFFFSVPNRTFLHKGSQQIKDNFLKLTECLRRR